MDDPAAPRRSRRRRSRGPLLLTALGLGLVTVLGSGAVVLLAARVLTGVPDGDLPMADVVELLKVALAVGLSKWAATV